MLRSLKALPTLMRVGFAEAVAYRAEMLVWVLSTTMPFVMLALWSAVAEASPVQAAGGRSWTSSTFVAYYLCMFIVRQLSSSWAAWEINWEVRQGTLSMRLLRPLHPVVMYGVQNVAAMPMRLAVTLPVLVGIAFTSGAQHVTRSPAIWGLWVLSMTGGWLITFFANVAIGAMSMYLDSSIKLMNVWFTLFFVFSGYLFPLDLFPPWLRTVANWLPFHSQVGLQVELMVGQHTVAEAVPLLARQWGWAALFTLLALGVWRGGVKRFQAFGG